MTIDATSTMRPAGLLADEDVLGPMQHWQSAGLRVALVTLVNVDGGAPRQPGAQMAVAEDGRFAGYLSGGCLEDAVVLEAQAAIARGENRLVRFGKGSPYIDIRLPCGSGLDLYLDQSIGAEQLAVMLQHRASRTPFVLRTDLTSGASDVAVVEAVLPFTASRRVGDTFERVYPPALQLLLLGMGPGLASIAALAATLGIGLRIFTSDETTRAMLRPLVAHTFNRTIDLNTAFAGLDVASSAVLVFHEHDREPELLGSLLRSRCFYIGALGNHAVHRERLAELSRRGIADADLRRIRAPVGSIAGAKSKVTLSVGVLAEMMAEAKALNLIA